MASDRRPHLPDITGDDSVLSPNHNQPSDLLAERGTDRTIRAQADSDGNQYVHIAKDSSAEGAGTLILATNKISGITSAMGEQTVLTYTITTERAITSINVSGTIYAKAQVYKNLTRIDTMRMGPNRNLKFEPFTVTSGDIIDVKVSHTRPAPTAGDYECTIRGV